MLNDCSEKGKATGESTVEWIKCTFWCCFSVHISTFGSLIAVNVYFFVSSHQFDSFLSPSLPCLLNRQHIQILFEEKRCPRVSAGQSGRGRLARPNDGVE